MGFKGGIHPNNYNKVTASKKIEVARLPKIVVLPLSQHAGAPCEPPVKAGVLARTGQKIADSAAPI
jgi:Na+-translocating ferredoxin:NAD+ oxidoreductase subunit C